MNKQWTAVIVLAVILSCQLGYKAGATDPFNGWYADIIVGENASRAHQYAMWSYVCGKVGNPTDVGYVSNLVMRLPRLQYKTKTNQYARAWRVNMGRLHAAGRFKKFKQPKTLIAAAWQQVTNQMGDDAKYGFVKVVIDDNWNWRTNFFNVVE